jgi:mannose-6-phosphate isomerase-like protein (cupin superfamily)
MNRVVTGFDTAGKPVIVHRGEPPTVISGQVVLVIGDDEITLGPGDSVVQQPGVPHDWKNRGTERAVMVGVLLSAR